MRQLDKSGGKFAPCAALPCACVSLHAAGRKWRKRRKGADLVDPIARRANRWMAAERERVPWPRQCLGSGERERVQIRLGAN